MTDTPPLLDYIAKQQFHGETYVEELDGKRLRGQSLDVFQAMQSGAWFTLAQLHMITGHPEASISARIRGYKAMGIDHDRERIGNGGLHRYRLKVGQ